jgi:hypothetical protein
LKPFPVNYNPLDSIAIPADPWYWDSTTGVSPFLKLKQGCI